MRRFPDGGPGAGVRMMPAAPLVLDRVVLLGHSGFLGQWFTRVLERTRPDVPVHGFSSATLDLTRLEPGAVRTVAGLLGPRTGVVVLSGVKRHATGDSRELFLRNTAIIDGVCRLLEGREVGRVVYFSSAAIYGEDVERGIIDDSTPPQCRSHYGLAKLTGEFLLEKALAGQSQTRLGILRPPTVYGPGDLTPTYGPGSFLRDARETGAVTLWGDGAELRDFVYAEDVARFGVRYLFSDHCGPLNLASGHSVSFRQALDAVEAVLGLPVVRRSRPRSKDSIDLRFDPSALRRFAPDFMFTSLVEGLRRTAHAAQATGPESGG